MRTIALHALLAAASAAALCGAALAQQPIQQLPPLPGPGGMPTAASGIPQPVRPAMSINGPARPVAAQPAESSGAAQTPAQQAGGYMVDPPRPGAADPAMRMTLDSARATSESYQAGAQSALANMTAKNQEQTPVAQLPNAPIQGEGDLQSLVKSQRNIRVLNQQVEEAKKAVELWHILYNNDDAKQWREKEEKVADARKKDEDASRQREAQAAAQAAQQQAAATLMNGGGAIASALASPPPVAPKVVEVSGSQALLLVPGKGEVWARAGATLNGSYRLLSVSPKRVEAMGPKGREALAYGTSVTGPAGAPPPPAGLARPAPTVPAGPVPRP